MGVALEKPGEAGAPGRSWSGLKASRALARVSANGFSRAAPAPIGRALADAAAGAPAIAYSLGLPRDKVAEIGERAAANGTSFLGELLSSGLVGEESLYRAVARYCGLRFLSRIDASQLVMRDQERRAALGSAKPWPVARLQRGEKSLTLLVPRDEDLERLIRFRRDWAGFAERVAVVPPSELRRAILERTGRMFVHEAEHGLGERFPHLSARIVANAWQGACLGALAVAVPLAFAVWPAQAVLGLHLIASVFFFMCVLLRILALGRAAPPRLARLDPADPADMPVYTVLVALYREKAVVSQLLVALGRLQWPRSRLQVKLVCEADDAETLAALRAHRLSPWVEIVEVPPSGPRTKPKALAHALPLCGGELIALYDAEDRPHSMQLVEAWQRFSARGPDLACVQAPLLVTNPTASLLARMFAFEYSALFRGLLP